MKRIMVLALAGIMAASMAFSAEVTKDKKDISILPVFASKAAAKQQYFDAAYFDSAISKVFSDLKRFNVIGYSFRMDKIDSVDGFIKTIQDAKKKAALADPKFMDEELGAIVISGEDLEKLAKSFFVVIPTISTFQVKGEWVNNLITGKSEYKQKANVTISVRFIDTDGKLLDVYNQDGEGTEDNETKAYSSAVNNAMFMFTKFVRSMEQFKLKSAVKELRSDGVATELGRNMGVLPGYEFTITRVSKDEFQNGGDIGLIRVKQVAELSSLATTIFGSPKVGDQLVEAPMANARITPFLDAYLTLPTAYFNTITMIPAIGLAAEYEIGYDLTAEARISYILAPSGYYYGLYGYFVIPAVLEVGGTYEMYMGAMSLQLGADIGLAGAYAMSLYDSQFYPTDVIGKVKLALNLQFSQSFKLRVSGGFAGTIGFGYSAGLTGPVASGELVFRF